MSLSGIQYYFQHNRIKLLYLFCSLFLLVLLLERVLIVFSYHGQIAGIDNNFSYPVMRLLKSLDIYPDPENYPFAVNPYAPVFFYISWCVCKLFGIQASDGIQIFFVTRGLCLLFDLATTYVLYRIMHKKLSVSAPLAFATAVFFLFQVSYWSYTMNRSDSLILFWFSLIVSFFISYLNKSSVKFLFIIALLCNLAVFTKQNALIFPVAIGTVLLYYKKWNHLTVLILFQACLLGLSLLLFTRLYPDGHFLAHLVRALNNKIDFRWFYVEIFKRLTSSYIIIPLAAGIFIAIRHILQRKKDDMTAISLIAVIQTAWSLAIALKWGSHVGYLHESFFCLFIIIAVCAEKKMVLSKINITYPLLFILTFIFANTALQLYFYNINDQKEEKKAYQEQQQVANMVLKELPPEKYVFSYTDFYHDFFKVLLQDKVVLPNIDAVDCCTLPDGNFNYTRLWEGFKTGKIEFIIYHKDSVFTFYQGADLTKYKYYQTIGNYSIYKHFD